MSQNVSFFTPVYYDPNLFVGFGDSLCNWAEESFAWGSKRAEVSRCDLGSATIAHYNVSWKVTALKVAQVIIFPCFLFFLIVKCVFRATHSFQVETATERVSGGDSRTTSAELHEELPACDSSSLQQGVKVFRSNGFWTIYPSDSSSKGLMTCCLGDKPVQLAHLDCSSVVLFHTTRLHALQDILKGGCLKRGNVMGEAPSVYFSTAAEPAYGDCVFGINRKIFMDYPPARCFPPIHNFSGRPNNERAIWMPFEQDIPLKDYLVFVFIPSDYRDKFEQLQKQFPKYPLVCGDKDIIFDYFAPESADQAGLKSPFSLWDLSDPRQKAILEEEGLLPPSAS